MKKEISQKVFNALNNWRLKPTEWKRKWYNYIVSIQDLYIERNNKNWLIVDVYNIEESFLERISITIRVVCEFWCVHNKMFLND